MYDKTKVKKIREVSIEWLGRLWEGLCLWSMADTAAKGDYGSCSDAYDSSSYVSKGFFKDWSGSPLSPPCSVS